MKLKKTCVIFVSEINMIFKQELSPQNGRYTLGWMLRIRIISFQKKFHNILPDIIMLIKGS